MHVALGFILSAIWPSTWTHSVRKERQYWMMEWPRPLPAVPGNVASRETDFLLIPLSSFHPLEGDGQVWGGREEQLLVSEFWGARKKKFKWDQLLIQLQARRFTSHGDTVKFLHHRNHVATSGSQNLFCSYYWRCTHACTHSLILKINKRWKLVQKEKQVKCVLIFLNIRFFSIWL